jgi:Bacterial SH3 domain
MKKSLAWLWLIGAVLYAVSVWLSADAVNIAGHKGQKSASSSPTIATPTESPKTEQLVEARTEPIAPQSSLDPALSSLGTASEPAQKAEAASEASTAAPAERFVIQSAANIRNGPSSKSTLIGTAPAGAELEVAERKGGWVRFVDPATSHTGWIYEGLLAPVGAQSVSNATRTVSGGVKQRAGDRPYSLGYARNPSAEEFGASKRRFGVFARRRMVREGLLGTD